MTTIEEFGLYNSSPAEVLMDVMLELGQPKQWLMNGTVFQYLNSSHLCDWWDWNLTFRKVNVLFGIPIKICSHENQPLTLTIRQIVERSLAAPSESVDEVLCHLDYVL